MKNKVLIKSKGVNYYILVDSEDFDRVNQFKWSLKTGHTGIQYAFRSDENNKTIYLHRFILRLDKSKKNIVDHIDRNGLNNQKVNLRLCDYRTNAMNTGLYKHNTSGYKGVYYDKARDKWVAQLMVNQKNIYLGRFYSIKEAILARRQGEALFIC